MILACRPSVGLCCCNVQGNQQHLTHSTHRLLPSNQHLLADPRLSVHPRPPCPSTTAAKQRQRRLRCSSASAGMDFAPHQDPSQQQASTSQSQVQQGEQQSLEQQHQQQTVPFALGLTGSIGMGKSTVSGFFRGSGIPVLEADDVVHSLYAPGGAAVAPVAAAFPSAVVDGAVSRPALSACIVGNEAAMKQLEVIVHPLVEAARLQFLREAAIHGQELVVFDIPLLYETGAEKQLDAVAVVSASADAQRERVLARPGMTNDKFEAILARQVPDAEKRRRADFVIDTSTSLEQTQAQVQQLIEQLKGRTGAALAEALQGQKI